MVFYTDPTGAYGDGRVAGVHRGPAMTNPELVFTIPSPYGMCNGSGEGVFAQNYNGAGIYYSATGVAGSWAAVTPASDSYPAYGVAHHHASNTLYQTGRFGGAGPTDCFRSINGGAWANISNMSNANIVGVCVNNATDGSVYMGVTGGISVGIWKQTAGSGSFAQVNTLATTGALAVSPNGNVYTWASDNLYVQTAGVGAFNLVTGITNATLPDVNTSALAFDIYGNLYAAQGGSLLDILKISLEDEVISDSYTYNLYWNYIGGNAALPPAEIIGIEIPLVTSPYNHTGLGTSSYYYVVTATSAITGFESIASNEVSAIPFQPTHTAGHIIW